MTRTEEFLTIAEAARVLRLGERTTYRLAATGVLPVVHLGRSVRVPRDALITYLEELALDAVGSGRGRAS
jgi:excisionase family DNA binding protein